MAPGALMTTSRTKKHGYFKVYVTAEDYARCAEIARRKNKLYEGMTTPPTEFFPSGCPMDGWTRESVLTQILSMGLYKQLKLQEELLTDEEQRRLREVAK